MYIEERCPRRSQHTSEGYLHAISCGCNLNDYLSLCHGTSVEGYLAVTITFQRKNAIFFDRSPIYVPGKDGAHHDDAPYIMIIYMHFYHRWASPALAVPKPGSSKLRFTVDLRGPNARTVPIQSAMPHLESSFQNVLGSTCFRKFDAAHGYWQLPLAPQSQEMMSIQTPLGVYSSNRLLQGGYDSGNHFQAVIAEKFQERVQKMLQ